MAHGLLNLYRLLSWELPDHLNAEEEPEMEDYPSEKDFPNFRKRFGP
jgi:hypothetical protein